MILPCTMAFLALSLCGLVTLASCSPAASPGCGAALPPGLKKGAIQGGWKVKFNDPLEARSKRDYAMYVPTSYRPNSPMALVLDFHGFYSNDMWTARHDGVSLAAEREGFMIAYPDGTKDYRKHKWWNNWNGGGSNGTGGGKYGKKTCLPDHSKYPCYDSCARAGLCEKGYNRKDCACSGCADDVGFIAALLVKLKRTFCIDESRVHGAGMSTGAVFLYYLATTSVGTQLASIVPTEGSFLLGFLNVPKVPMPVIDIHGTKDHCVPSNTSNAWGKYKRTGCPVKGLGFNGCTVGDDTFLYHTTSDILGAWATANSCPSDAKPKPITTPFDGRTGWSCVLPHGDKCGAQTQFCTHNLGHTWPFHEGKHKVRTRAYGEVLWSFMKDKRRDVNGMWWWAGNQTELPAPESLLV